jgi:enoyl-CoA hydratase
MSQAEGIRFERQGALGIILLDRPKALNALTHEMVRAMSRRLVAWKDDPEVGAVLVRSGGGRAFCAGGDVRAVSAAYQESGLEAVRPFFRDEYRLNWRIHHFPKPFLALLNGVTMGGGVGISVHGRHRIATENIMLAMPETAIGMFPDVGATYALTHLPGASPAMGMFLGLTGTRLGPGECLAFGLATDYLPAARIGEFIGRLAVLGPEDLGGSLLASTLGDFDRWDEPTGPLGRKRALIEEIFAADSLELLLERLAAEPSGWGAEQRSVLEEASPFALRLSFEQLRRGRRLGFEEAMRLEYRMVQRVLAQGDFHEGVRALLLDKDRSPRWRDRHIADVPMAEIEACMAPLPVGQELSFDWSPDDPPGADT